jgi:hypothetical protein
MTGKYQNETKPQSFRRFAATKAIGTLLPPGRRRSQRVILTLNA